MAKRPRFSRYRRLPPVFRPSEHKLPDANQSEERISLYLTGAVLDEAEAQATRLGFPNAQDYCTELLLHAIEAERVREHMDDVESKRGPMEGLHEIADDPEYLAELRAARSAPHSLPEQIPATDVPPEQLVVPVRFLEIDDEGITFGVPLQEHAPPPAPAIESPRARPSLAAPAPVGVPEYTQLSPHDQLSAAAYVVIRHAGQANDDPAAFLPSLRRGQPVPPEEVSELAQALQTLESEYRGRTAMDRRLTFALHRLAYESQILHTDAWPGSFDVWTVDMLRAVQEAVERILSGQDIRYYPDQAQGGPSQALRPENLR